MKNKKPWFKSKTHWGAILGILGVIGMIIRGDISVDKGVILILGFFSMMGLRFKLEQK